LQTDLLEVSVSLLRDFLELITSQSGALVYHLVTLFAIQLILGVAVGHWQRRRDDASARLLVMGIGFFLARTILMLLAVLNSVALLSSDVVFPPLERFLDLATLVLAVWAFLPVPGQKRRLSTPLLIVALLAAVGTYAAFATLWPGAEAQGLVYNGYWQERVWEVSTTATLVLALMASIAWRGADWGWLVCLLGLWLAGHSLQLIAPVADANSAGWVRLANLAALPLLAALVYRRALAATLPSAKASKEMTLGAVGVLKAIQRIEADGHVESALELAASSIARTVSADMVAIGLRVPGSIDLVRIMALHPATSVMLANQEATLTVSKYPLLSTALQSRRLERAIADRKVSRVSGLYYRLGFNVPGPLLVQPLIARERVLGVMLVGNPDSQREWRTDDEQILQAMAAALAAAIAGEQEREVALNQELEEARKQIRRMAERAEQLEAMLERQRQRTEEISTKLRLREEKIDEQKETVAALAMWQEEVRKLSQARDALRTQLSHWQDEAEKLSQAKAELEARVTRVGATESINGRLGGILVGDAQGNVILASQGVHRLLDRPRADLLDASFQALFEEPLWKRTVLRLLGGKNQFGEVTTVSLDLGERVVHAELARLPENENWPGRLAATFYLAEGATIQSEMISSLIHELRTPMTSIAGYTDLLLGEKTGILGESQRQFLLRVEANIKRMEALLNDLIKVTDVDVGQIELVPEPVDLVDIIDSVLDSLSARFDEKALDVQSDLARDLPPVYADRDSLHQVVLNLVSNAALASEPGTDIQLSARVEEQPDEVGELPSYLLFSVTDTGGGIAPEDQRQVFRRFYRANNPLVEGLGETGVGLSVAKALVEANGGRIWVESEMGTGSTFNLILPLSPVGENQDSR
jgi:signal transduction histidine kinase/GAF domain-containing protein